jgi:hypothetical protein
MIYNRGSGKHVLTAASVIGEGLGVSLYSPDQINHESRAILSRGLFQPW